MTHITLSLSQHSTALREHPRPESSLVGERKGEVIIHLPQLLGAIVDRPPSVALHPEHRGNCMARLLGVAKKEKGWGLSTTNVQLSTARRWLLTLSLTVSSLPGPIHPLTLPTHPHRASDCGHWGKACPA